MSTGQIFQPVPPLIPWRVKLRRGEFADRGLSIHPPTFSPDHTRIKSFDLGKEALSSIPEQLSAIARDFVTCKPLNFNRQFNRLRPYTEFVWELKSPQIRIFGWVPQFDCFIACHCDVIHNLKLDSGPDSYLPYIGSVIEIRARLGLNHVASKRPEDNFSNIC